MSKRDASAEKAENEGLAARIIELRGVVEQNRVEGVKAMADLKGEVARMSDRVNHALSRVDTLATDWDRRKRELETAVRDSGEQVRAAGEIASKMNARVKVLDELRETAVDPHELIKPVRREMAELKSALESLDKNFEVKIEALRPKRRAEPLETR
jgi:chromosome segregation ATPase